MEKRIEPARARRHLALATPWVARTADLCDVADNDGKECAPTCEGQYDTDPPVPGVSCDHAHHRSETWVSRFEGMCNFVNRSHETTHECLEINELFRAERTENMTHCLEAALADDGMAFTTGRRDADRDDASIGGQCAALCKVELFESLNCPRCG